jgi:hypothetical protein
LPFGYKSGKSFDIVQMKKGIDFKCLEMIYRMLLILAFKAFGLGISFCFSQKLFNDSIIKPASLQYNQTSFLGRILMGTNYRNEWATPVAMPVFRLNDLGFTIKELGGGMQTKSLRLLDKNKKEWVLRSVDKEVEEALPKGMRNRIVKNFVQDLVSAAHPYAPLVVYQLAKAANIIAARPKLYFVADDKSLGAYRAIFANTVCFLEQREPTPDNSDTENTEKVMEEIIEENDHLVLQEKVLQARLLDMLIGDWDRHTDQWRWGAVDSGTVKYYYAIPRDRDQAFFMTNGLVPKFIKIFAMKHINGFKAESKGLKNLNFKSWQFDKTFLNELDKETWERNVKTFQSKLTDRAIEQALQKLPPEIYAIDGHQIEKKLKSRRNSLLKNALKYYEFISGTVSVFGTEEKEIFEIKGDNKIMVSVYRAGKDQKPSAKIYEREFTPDDTGYIYLDGFGGDDTFFIEKNTSSRIKIKIRGGKGNDVYNLKGNIKSKVYDSVAENKK